VSIHKIRDGLWKVRWREGGHNRSTRVHGSHELAKKIERKKMSARDENRHLDIKREVNFRMTELIDRYWDEYGSKKKSSDRERSVLSIIRDELGAMFVREVDGQAVDRWYQGLTAKRGLSPGTAVRHFNVMHHMMEKASIIWAAETGIDRNPADLVEVKRPDDQRERYLSAEELRSLKAALDGKMYRQDHRAINRTFYRLRLLVLIALTTGMRMAEIFALTWGDVVYREGLIAVRSKLKGGKIRYVPMTPELAAEIQRFPAVIGEERIFPPKHGAKGERQRVEGSFETVLDLAGIVDFRFHDLRQHAGSQIMPNPVRRPFYRLGLAHILQFGDKLNSA
jgi:integrase